MNIKNITFDKTPIILAPMEDITELPFRILCKEMGADLVFSEFIASEGLIRDVEKSIIKLRISNDERPIGIQIFGGDVNSLVKAAEKALESSPDIIDINCGCPVKKVVNKGGGSAMLRTPEKMIQAVSQIVKFSNIPVTVKTRIGWDEQSINIIDIAQKLQDAGIAALTIHGRTRCQMYNGEANWDVIASVKANPMINIPIIGNGDIDSGTKAVECLKKSNVDGLMIGRAAVGNPWIFREIKAFINDGTIIEPPSIEERVSTCNRHIAASIEYKGEIRTIMEMRHHYAKYFHGIHNFKPFKLKLMQALSISELYDIMESIRVNDFTK